MKVGAPVRILAVAAACAVILVGFVINEGAARANGQEVLLPVEGADPRDLLSGHYVQLAFDRRLEPGEVCPPAQNGDWAALRGRGDIYVVVGGGGSRAEVEQVGPLPVKAHYTCTPTLPSSGDEGTGALGRIHLNLNIERFYVSQTEEERIETALAAQRNDASRRVLAIVSVGRDGIARLKGLVIDNERLELNWL